MIYVKFTFAVAVGLRDEIGSSDWQEFGADSNSEAQKSNSTSTPPDE